MRYRVSFVNELPNDSGHMFRCCQQSFEIYRARSRERAIEAAKLRFARHQAVRDWRARATAIEVEVISDDET